MKFLLLMLLLTQTPAGTGDRTIPVRHDHAFGSCTGTLIFSDEGVRYDTAHEEHARFWRYPEVRLFELASNDRVEIHTYESRGAFGLWREQTFIFDVLGLDPAEPGVGQALFESVDGQIGPDLYTWLLAKSPRPVLNRGVSAPPSPPGATDPDVSEDVLQELPVRHDHFLGGCQGTLRITGEQIVYMTEHPGDSRIWRVADVESFASTGDFDLRISTRNETFHFELKLPLDRATYAYLWDRVYEPQIQTYRGRVQ